ncbi:hypothetical protein ID866_11433 [Astraeus odoratus]|nr:hypothetical protein ID866_11433 [Astraeus odoratus]
MSMTFWPYLTHL